MDKTGDCQVCHHIIGGKLCGNCKMRKKNLRVWGLRGLRGSGDAGKVKKRFECLKWATQVAYTDIKNLCNTYDTCQGFSPHNRREIPSKDNPVATK